MAWYRERAWQQTIAILLVLTGAVLIYGDAGGSDELDGGALLGVLLFALGIAAPLIAQALHAYREDTARNDDV
jgi:hypothetical protein